MPDDVLKHFAVPQRLADLDLSVPHLDEYFGVWAILEDPFRSAIARVNRLDLRLHVEQMRAMRDEHPRAAEDRYGYDVAPGGVAVINLTGPLTKYASSLSGGNSTAMARRKLRNALADEAVSSIVLRIDSPGGTTSGTDDLAEEVARANKQKRVVAYIEDMGASAAYWIASQASRVYANRTAIVGAIGTYTVLEDSSAAAAEAGLKVHVVRAGEFKGMGIQGTEITPEQLAEVQRTVDSINDRFIRSVAAGRGISLTKARELNDGRVHVGEAAVAAGLIDAVQSFDETVAQLSRSRPKPTTTTSSKPRSAAMADNQTQETEPTAPATISAQAVAATASYHDLVDACPGADAEFICGQLKTKATVAQAQKAWMAEQNARLLAARKEADEAKTKAAKPGAEPLSTGTEASGTDADPVAAWEAEVDAELTKLGANYPEHGGRGRMPKRAKAVSNVAKRRPDLHRAFVASQNPRMNDKLPRVFEV